MNTKYETIRTLENLILIAFDDFITQNSLVFFTTVALKQ